MVDQPTTRWPVIVAALCTFGCDPAAEDEHGARDAGSDADAGITHDAGLDADARTPDAGCAPSGSVPARVLFIGNSFTALHDVPGQFQELVVSAGLTPPTIGVRAVGGQTLEGHRADTDPAGAPAQVAEGWDVVVLQELSTRPTDAIGPAEQFKIDATWFHDLARTANSATRVFLYETWARHPDHQFYPATFADAAAMQAQLRFHYLDAADNYIPAHTSHPAPSEVVVARVGDAWEHHLAQPGALRLHATDDYHQNESGAYLNALVLFGTIYDRRTAGLTSAAAAPGAEEPLQSAADWATGATRAAFECTTPLAVGDTLRVDFGSIETPTWTSHAVLRSISGSMSTESGVTTNASVATSGWSGIQTGGTSVNELGLPASVTQDSFWVGSFDGHAAALLVRGEVVLYGLDTGTYRLSLFASRQGDDGAYGRLTRYQAGDQVADLDAADNVGSVAVLDELRPDQHGRLKLSVGVSPEGSARFAYLGGLLLTKTAQ